MGDVTKSFVAANGKVFVGLTGVNTLPTSASTPLSAEWLALDLGTISEAGLSIQYTRTSKKIKDFDGGTYRTVQEEFADGFKAKFYDVDNHALIKAVFGEDNVTITPATGSVGESIVIDHSATQLPFLQAVLTLDSGAKRKSYTSAICQVSEVAEIVDVYNDVTAYEVTFDVLRDGNGVYLKELRNDGVVASGS